MSDYWAAISKKIPNAIPSILVLDIVFDGLIWCLQLDSSWYLLTSPSNICQWFEKKNNTRRGNIDKKPYEAS